MQRSPSGGQAPGLPAGLLLLVLVLQGSRVPCAAQGDTRTSPIDAPDAQSPLRDPSREGSIDVLLKQGTNARRQGKLEMAIELLSAAHQLAPERYDVHLMLADTLRRAGRAAEATKRYDEAIAVDPTRAEAYIGRVLLLWDQFNYTSALTIGTRALELVAEDGHALILANVAETQRRRGHLKEATGLFGEAIEEAPDLALARAGLGRLAEEAGDLDGALRQWEHYIRLRPEDGSAVLRREELLELRAALSALDEAIARAPRPDLLVEAGRLRAVAGEAAGAAAAFRQALESDPLRVDARRGLALALLDRGDLGSATIEFRRVLEHRPTDAISLYNLVALAAGAQNDGAQEQAWIDLLTARPDDPFAARGFAQFLRRVGDAAVQRAVEHFDRRASHGDRLLRAILRATAGRWEEAAGLLYEALLADPSDPRTLQATMEILNLHPPMLQNIAARAALQAGEQATVAELLLMARLNGLGGHWDGMLDLAQRAVEADPGLGAARSLLAEARLKANGDRAGALRAMQRAVVVDPHRLVAHVDLAMALLRAGRADLAAEAARSGLEQLPGAAELHAILGGVLAEQGDLEGAAQAYAASLQADPADSLGLSRSQYPLVLAALGRNVEARHALAGDLAPIPGLLYLEAWMFVRDSNIDPDFNGQDWNAWRDRYLGELFTTEDAYQAISTMLSSLGDRYTRLRGPDETAALYLTRHDQETVTDQLGRKRAHGRTVVARGLADGRGYIQLNNLTDPRAVEELRRALGELGDREEIILDLRGNTGGLTRSADAIGDLFVGPGAEAGVDEEGGKRAARITAGDGALTSSAVTVLVDEQTASAAERLALTLEETGRGRIVGDTTQGKGRFQASRVLPGGVTLLVSKGQTLDRAGRPVQDRGLSPRLPAGDGSSGSAETNGTPERDD
jgi:C-terminal processing protease CtpA/Prc/Tfp pilus assembly protein PilF